MSDQQPIYDAKVKKVLEMLKFKDRDEVAEELKYKNWRSLDMYMRRKNFTFDTREGQYIPAHTRVEKLNRDPKNYASAKVVSIITAFEEADIDPKLVAKQEGFKEHKEMAEYMKNKGFEWNVYKNNYVKVVGKVDDADDRPPETVTKTEGKKPYEGIEEYLPFIRFLYEKRDDVYQLLSGTKEDGKIPRYALPGLVRTKAIYMSDMIAKLTGEFSREKNVTQREIMEAALVEYLQKYGFKREIEALLKNQ
ncbi:conserved hypothetical protein [Candidatus Desulfosporosinus infrequens]|uniref:Uncharacterized protein n=1 Tax=Candidatus Desulfosporosinus infrequens TaxID=2043169 RepID=A0A2U3L5R3_9FIRM|nr:conserved hypothetical protein [Candidatus Desulfosporosinus infrequens]